MRDVRGLAVKTGFLRLIPETLSIKAELHNFSGICPCLWQEGQIRFMLYELCRFLMAGPGVLSFAFASTRLLQLKRI
jgi:hypothetical protein